MQKSKAKSSRRATTTPIRFGGQRREERGKMQSHPLLPFGLYFRPLSVTCLLLVLLGLIGLGFFPAPGLAQSPPATPYASINPDAVNYNGPGRDAEYDLGGSEIRVGLLAPLTGLRQAEGNALRRAAEMAIEKENATSLPGGRHLALITRDEDGPWGQASMQVVHMVFDDQAVALITSTDGGSAHLAEQVGNKIGVPILTLSSDTTTTEINLPWIFRLGPTDTMQAQTFAHDIYIARKLKRVALLTQGDHDSRVGSDEFAKAARAISAPDPTRIIVEPNDLAPGADLSLGSAGSQGHQASTAGPSNVLWSGLKSADAVVIWTDAATANLLVARLREEMPSTPLYLCRKAAQGVGSEVGRPRCRACSSEDGGVWTTEAVDIGAKPHEAFAMRYRQRFGADPGIDAAQAYDAVRLVAASLRRSGPNRARLRDALADVSSFAGASGVISFDHAGNDTSQVTLFRLR